MKCSFAKVVRISIQPRLHLSISSFVPDWGRMEKVFHPHTFVQCNREARGRMAAKRPAYRIRSSPAIVPVGKREDPESWPGLSSRPLDWWTRWSARLISEYQQHTIESMTVLPLRVGNANRPCRRLRERAGAKRRVMVDKCVDLPG